MKKYSFYISAALFATTSLVTSCDDSNDCGCECNMPVVESVKQLDNDSTITGMVEGGAYIEIVGKNLGNVTALQVGDQIVTVKPAYRRDNAIVLQAPTVVNPTVGRLITSSCQEGIECKALNIIPGAPTVYMIYNEFVADGDILKIKGANFIGNQLEVDFVKETGDTVKVSGSNVVLQGTEGKEIYVTLPAGLGSNVKIITRNNEYKKQAESPILLRDRRNMLVDFDENLNWTFATGSIDKANDGSYSLAELSWRIDDPIYSVGASNLYGVFTDASSWKCIAYAPDATAPGDDARSIFGPAFKSSVMKDPSTAENYVVKFEMNVPKDYPTKYAVFTLGFSASDETTQDNFRNFAAGLQMSEITWDKSSQTDGWKYVDATTFNTDGWMTVTVPFSEFIWAFTTKNYPAHAQNISEGDYSKSELQDAFGDPENHYDYTTFYKKLLSNEDGMWTNFGGLIVSFNSSDGPENASDVNKAAHIAIDNIRIVPNDGNGAIYPKAGYGVPSQEYYKNPRTKAFEN